MFLRIVLSSCARSLCVALCPNGLAYMLPLDPLKVYIAGVHAEIKFGKVKNLAKLRPFADRLLRHQGMAHRKTLTSLIDVSKHF